MILKKVHISRGGVKANSEKVHNIFFFFAPFPYNACVRPLLVVFCGGQENTLLNYTTLLGKLVMLFLAMVDGKGVTLEVS